MDAEKVIKRLHRYAVRRGYEGLADDFVQWVFLKNAEKPDSNYLTKDGFWLLTDFLRDYYGGGRVRENKNNRIFKKYGIGKLDRKPVMPGLSSNYLQLELKGKELFESDEMPLDEKIHYTLRLRKVKNIVDVSEAFRQMEKEVFNLLLLGFTQKEISVSMGKTESRVSQISRSLIRKIEALERFG